TWTTYPRYIADIKAAAAKEAGVDAGDPRMQRGGGRGTGIAMKYYEQLRKPEWRDPRGYILPADQPDFLTATKFMNTLIKSGVTVERATSAFSAGGKQYPAGSFVVRTAQAFRPHVLDMFEPQDHPNDFPYPGGPPIPPYDSAGWTLAFQMGVKFDRVLDAFDGPFERVSTVSHPHGGVAGPAKPPGYVVSHHQNDAFVVVNRLMKAGEDVYWPADRGIGGAPGGT